ncbi:MAG: cyclic pyranopterin monophosphate synthase MoaC [Gemmatimonadaceae bacterium]
MDLTHSDEAGQARMVNITGKEATHRVARARGRIRMLPATLEAIRANVLKKGDAISIARVAGIMAAKRTSDLIPLCHPIPLTDLQVTCALDDTLPGIIVEASAETTAQTGVEMEALVAVNVTLITLYDMAKGIDKTMELGEIFVVEKRGGKSGDWSRP